MVKVILPNIKERILNSYMLQTGTGIVEQLRRREYGGMTTYNQNTMMEKLMQSRENKKKPFLDFTEYKAYLKNDEDELFDINNRQMKVGELVNLDVDYDDDSGMERGYTYRIKIKNNDGTTDSREIYFSNDFIEEFENIGDGASARNPFRNNNLASQDGFLIIPENNNTYTFNLQGEYAGRWDNYSQRTYTDEIFEKLNRKREEKYGSNWRSLPAFEYFDDLNPNIYVGYYGRNQSDNERVNSQREEAIRLLGVDEFLKDIELNFWDDSQEDKLNEIIDYAKLKEKEQEEVEEEEDEEEEDEEEEDEEEVEEIEVEEWENPRDGKLYLKSENNIIYDIETQDRIGILNENGEIIKDEKDEEEDEEIEVEEWENPRDGKLYLKSKNNVLYDIETQDPIGILNENGEIIPLPEE